MSEALPARASDTLRVTAIVLAVEGESREASRSTLAAVRAQSRTPDRILMVAATEPSDGTVPHDGTVPLDDAIPFANAAAPDEDSRVDEGPYLDDGPYINDGPELTVVGSRIAGLRGALAAAGVDEGWLWIVPVGSDPGRSCLEAQVASASADPRLAAVGAKRLVRRTGQAPRRPRGARGANPTALNGADSADGLVDVGITLTRSAHPVTSADRAEVDQGQDDWRRDVLAVPVEGLFVDAEALARAGGLDPALPDGWAVVELCHRLWRGGRRVEVAPEARALAVSALVRPRPDFDDAVDPGSAQSSELRRRRREDRVGRLGTALALRPPLLAALSLVLLPLLTLARMAGAVVTHRPSAVLDELRIGLRAAVLAPGIIARSLRAQRGARVPRRRLAPLFLPRAEVARRGIGAVWARTIADDDRSRRIRRTTWGIAGTTHGVDDADYGRHSAWTLAVAIASVLAALVALRPLLGPGALGGAGLIPLPMDPGETWEAAWSGWIPGGLGHRGQADPLIRLLGHVPIAGDVLVDGILLAAIPAAALGAWWAAGAVTRAIGARLVLSAAWALAPSLLGAVAEGRWPLALVHVLLPLFALALARAIGLPHKRSQASVSAAAGAGLVLLMITAVQPVLLVLAAVLVAVIAVMAPGRRLRLLWVLVPSAALMAPYLGRVIEHPRTLLAVGAQTGVPLPARHGALGTLDALWLAPRHGWESVLPSLDGLAGWLPALLLVPVAVAALLAPFLRGDAGRVGRFATVLAAGALGAAIVAQRVATGVDAGSPTAAPVHGIVSAATILILVAAGCGFDALARRDHRMRTARRRFTAAVAAAVALSTAALVAGWMLALPSSLDIAPGGGASIPAVAADQGRSDDRVRTLVLGDGSPRTGDVPARLVIGGGADGAQTSAVVRDRALEAATDGNDAVPAQDHRVLATTAALLSGDDDAGALRDLAVGYVLVPGAPEADPAVLTALDASPLLERVSQGARGSLWRVAGAAPRATISADGATGDRAALPSGPIDIETTLAAASSPRTVTLAEARSGAWSATLDGAGLTPVTVDGWAQGFIVPAGASGALEVTATAPLIEAARLALWVAIGLTVLVAVPWRGRAVRTEEVSS